MVPPSPPEAWLRGPLPGIDAALMPAAHAVVQARDDLAAGLADAADAELWARPGGAASAGFHVRHLAGRFLTTLKIVRGLGAAPPA